LAEHGLPQPLEETVGLGRGRCHLPAATFGSLKAPSEEVVQGGPKDADRLRHRPLRRARHGQGLRCLPRGVRASAGTPPENSPPQALDEPAGTCSEGQTPHDDCVEACGCFFCPSPGSLPRRAEWPRGPLLHAGLCLLLFFQCARPWVACRGGRSGRGALRCMPGFVFFLFQCAHPWVVCRGGRKSGRAALGRAFELEHLTRAGRMPHGPLNSLKAWRTPERRPERRLLFPTALVSWALVK